MSTPLHDLFVSEDYEEVEDAWQEHGRRTYLHQDDATRGYITNLAKILAPSGWTIDPSKLRSFRHEDAKEIIELEPGGSEVTGHFLHWMKP
jgi:hypothetical protein